MGDIIDRAQRYEEQYRRLAIDAHFADRQAPVGLPAAVECSDCGDRIPAARRRAVPAATRCIQCQARHERTCGRPS